MMSSEPQSPPAPQDDSENLRTLTSEELFRGDRCILIDHYGTIYRLRKTKQGKLILNK